MIKKLFGHSTHLKESLHTYGQAQYTLSKNKPFDVLVWNMNKQKPARIIQTLTALSKKPDFALYQEASLSNQEPDPFSIWSKHAWIMAKNIYLPQKKLFSGVSTGSVFKRKEEKIWHSQNTETLLNTPKSGIATLHKVDQDSFDLLAINVHLLNFVNQNLFLTELEQLKSEITRHSGPMFIAGDFNTWSVNRKKLLSAWAQDLNLVETVFASSNRHRYSQRQLCFIFTKHLQVLQLKVLKEMTVSDHFPLWVQFKIKEM